jgi:hypothetical protein
MSYNMHFLVSKVLSTDIWNECRTLVILQVIMVIFIFVAVNIIQNQALFKFIVHNEADTRYPFSQLSNVYVTDVMKSTFHMRYPSCISSRLRYPDRADRIKRYVFERLKASSCTREA